MACGSKLHETIKKAMTAQVAPPPMPASCVQQVRLSFQQTRSTTLRPSAGLMASVMPSCPDESVQAYGGANRPDLWTSVAGPTQQWLLELVPGTCDHYHITSMGRPTCRRLLSYSVFNAGDQIDLWDQNVQNQIFQLVPMGDSEQFALRAVPCAAGSCSSWVSAQFCSSNNLLLDLSSNIEGNNN
jgi:hypothetical protein